MPRASASILMKRWRPSIPIAGDTCQSIANSMARCTVGRRNAFETRINRGVRFCQGVDGIQPESLQVGSRPQKLAAFESTNGPSAPHFRIWHLDVAGANRGHDGRRKLAD